MKERLEVWRGKQIRETQIRINDQTRHISNPVARQQKMAELEKSMKLELDKVQHSIRDQFKTEESQLYCSGNKIDLWGAENQRWALFVQCMDVITIRSKCSITEHVAQLRCPCELDLKLVSDHCWFLKNEYFSENAAFLIVF